MIKKTAVLLLSLLLLFCPTACRQNRQETEHSFSSWQIVKKPTYKHKGELCRSCTDEGCNYRETRRIKASAVHYADTTDGAVVDGIGDFEGDFLYIPSKTPDGKEIVGIAEQAFEDNVKIAHLIIEDGVREIGANAFAGCESLESAALPAETEQFGIGVFLSCASLSSVRLPSNLTGIPDSCFDGCRTLSFVDIPKEVKTIGYSAFNLCSGLVSVDLPKGLKTVSGTAFSDCTSLAEIGLPEGLTLIGEYAFSGCTSLHSVDLPKSLAELKCNAFFACTSLSLVTLPKSVLYLRSVDGYSPFYGCSDALTVRTDANERLPGWDECFDILWTEDSDVKEETTIRCTVVWGCDLDEYACP